MKGLNVDELSLEQKIGMVLMGTTGAPAYEENHKSTIKRIKNHALGTVWVRPHDDGSHVKYIKEIREAADYPVLVIMDAEKGYGKYKFGSHMSLGFVDDVEATYKCARAYAAAAKRDGYNGICSPILDIVFSDTLSTTRKFCLDKYGILRHAEAFIRGFHDAGVFSIVKHYPSISSGVDTHLFEGHCDYSREFLMDNSLYPYIELIKKGLLDGIMSGHSVIKNIDPDHPTSISKNVIDLVRNAGFNGIFITDDLAMLGIAAKYGEERFCRALKAGNDILLDFKLFDSEAGIKKALREGALTEEEITVAARRVVAMQNKTLTFGNHQLCDDDMKAVDDINRRSVIEITDDGTAESISRDGRHLFVIMTRKPDPFDGSDDEYRNKEWYRPRELAKYIKSKFKNSDVMSITPYPEKVECSAVAKGALNYEDTVFIYFSEFQPFTGGESFTSRIIAVSKSLVAANRAHTLVYFGNPNILKQLPHFERMILGCNQSDNNRYCIDVLAGDMKAEGKLPEVFKEGLITR